MFLVSYRYNGSDLDVEISAYSRKSAIVEFYCQVGKVDILQNIVPLYTDLASIESGRYRPGNHNFAL